MSLRELAKNLDVPIKLINKLEKGGRLGRYLDALEKRLNKQGYEDYMEEEMSIRRCLLYTSPSPRDRTRSRMPSSA